ncbi:MAG: hypothetical protein FJ347_07865 [Sphingomonadales bacterium]|nr:hypothetical protein [Sphingomonadales bacterium]
MKRLIITTLLFISISQGAYASHLMGADMQYTYLGNSKYRITAKIYRDCRGIPLSNPYFVVTAGVNGNASCGVFLTLP